MPDNFAYAWRIKGSESHLVHPNPRVIYADSVPFRTCLLVHSSGGKCTHKEKTYATLSGPWWNTDGLDIELQCLNLDALRPDAKADEARLLESSQWSAAVGIMPTNPSALYCPVAHHMHWCRLRLTADAAPAFRSVEDFSFEARIFRESEAGLPAMHLPPWISHVALIKDRGTEIPLSLTMYKFDLGGLLEVLSTIEAPIISDKEKENMKDDVLKLIEVKCVSVSLSLSPLFIGWPDNLQNSSGFRTGCLNSAASRVIKCAFALPTFWADD